MSARSSSSSAPILAFCHVPKTGGIAFNQILRQQFGGRHLDAIVRFRPGTRRNQKAYTLADLELDRWIYPRLCSIAGHHLSPAADYGELGKRFRWVTILRDPSRRFVSHYVHQVEKMEINEDFETWMSHTRHSNVQVKQLAGSEDVALAIEILRARCVVGLLEHYEQSMQMFQRSVPELALHVGRVPKVNSAKGRVDARALAQKHAAQIRKCNQLDQELYDFALNVMWPEQLKALTRTTVLPAVPAGGAWLDRSRLAWARVKRNVLYKPLVRMSQP